MRHYAISFALLAFAALTTSAQYAPQFGATVAVSDDGQILVSEGRNLLLPGSVFIYERAANGTWGQTAIVTPDDATDEPNGFGRTFAVSGTTMVVGAPTANAAYVFIKGSDGAWRQSARLTAGEENFGSSVALYGDNLLVGASGGREAAGAVYAYRRGAGGSWAQAGMLAVEDAEARDGFGSTLAVQGMNAIVAAPNKASRTGAVYSFRYVDGAWQPMGSLEYRGAAEGSRFGATLLLLGTHLVVGLPGHDNGIGAAALFKIDEDAGTWSFEGRVAPYAARGGEQFGSSLAFTRDRLWVGAPGANGREGTVYQFEPDPATGRMNGTWQMSPTALQFRASFGNAMAANDEVAVVGAVGFDNFEGAAFPFTPGADGWAQGSALYNDSGTFATVTGGQVECQEGEAGAFDCDNVDMVSFMSRNDIGAKRGIQVNDVWGWEDPQTGREYALIGRTNGTSFVDLTDPANPIFVGDLPKTETANQSLWRDIKVYKDHAFIVADGAGAHHMQVFDLTQLRNVQNPPATFKETAIYRGIYSSHNIIINEETGYAYAVGSDSGGETCGGALHMINIQDPTNPTFAGCFADTRTGRRGSGSTHDAQCVTYHGPDADYQGREICLSSNGTALSIADVTDKGNPVAVSIAEYPNVAYTHQGWLTDDHRYFYLNDEGDEVSGLTDATRTMILDLEDLDEPEVAGFYLADHNAIDHNLYVKGNLMYQTNYTAGLRILDISDPENPTEVGYFDTVPYGKNDNSPVLGAWSNYPYFKSGVIVVTSGREGVFFLKKKPVDL